MEKRTEVLFGIYMRKALPWLFTALLLQLLLFATYPYLYGNSIVGGEADILYFIQKIQKHSFILEIGVVYAMAYFLYYGAIGEQEHTFMGSLPIGRKSQYLCMTGSIFFVIFCSALIEKVLACILWNSKDVYLGGAQSTLCRLMLLLFLACLFFWLFNILPIENWWTGILILIGLLSFLLCLIRINISISYLFGSDRNILFYQLKNIWYCLTDLYTKERNPAQLQVVSTETQNLYAQRNELTIQFCSIFLLLTVVFFLWGRREFCKYGYLGKLKKWNLNRAIWLMVLATLWGAVYMGALGSMEMTWYKMAGVLSTDPENDDVEEADWSDVWFIQRIEGDDSPYSDTELVETYEERTAEVAAGGEQKIETTALLGKNRKSIEGKLEISAWDRGIIYCIPRTEGAGWAKIQLFIMLGLGAGLGLLFGIWQKRKISSVKAQ